MHGENGKNIDILYFSNMFLKSTALHTKKNLATMHANLIKFVFLSTRISVGFFSDLRICVLCVAKRFCLSIQGKFIFPY